MTSLSISSALDETLARLEALHSRTRETRASGLRLLEVAVARLDLLAPPEEVQAAPLRQRGERDLGSGRPAPDPGGTPFVPLPQRTTHGGPFGPKVRDKLIAAAIAKGDLW